MSTAAVKFQLTPEEYLVIEESAGERSEYCDGEMFAMSGGSYAHTIISTNLTTSLQNRLSAGSCRSLNGMTRIHVPDTELYTYPDASVVCGPPQFAGKGKLTIINPKLIVEVLSPSTERYDRTAKFWHYQRIITLKDYVLVTQDALQVERFSRQADDQWIYTASKGWDGILRLPSLDIEIPLREIYSGVEFETDPQTVEEKFPHPPPPSP